MWESEHKSADLSGESQTPAMFARHLLVHNLTASDPNPETCRYYLHVYRLKKPEVHKACDLPTLLVRARVKTQICSSEHKFQALFTEVLLSTVVENLSVKSLCKLRECEHAACSRWKKTEKQHNLPSKWPNSHRIQDSQPTLRLFPLQNYHLELAHVSWHSPWVPRPLHKAKPPQFWVLKHTGPNKMTENDPLLLPQEHKLPFQLAQPPAFYLNKLIDFEGKC